MIDEDAVEQEALRRTQEMRDRMVKAVTTMRPPAADLATTLGGLITTIHTTFEVLNSDPAARTYVARSVSEKAIMAILVTQGIMRKVGPATARFYEAYQRPKALTFKHTTQVSDWLNDYSGALKGVHQHTGTKDSARKLSENAAKIRIKLITYLSNIERD